MYTACRLIIIRFTTKWVHMYITYLYAGPLYRSQTYIMMYLSYINGY